ncbi:hypothetical protein [Verrucomicrobium spinosum]|uniref:hypothetical protein n=1 Tax=Verrucomicrobium spinosum TaxID=2736 RepID=UPI0009466CFA|nr:hypothetical protein [Verrucomicrobium spinosum]
MTTDHELSGATEAASLRFNTNTGSITTDGGVHTLSLSDGGILFTSDYGTGAAFDSNVSLTTAAAATDLVIHNFATGMVNFNAGITGAQNVIFSGAGTLTLGGTNNYTGATHINGNSIVAFDSVARFGATSEFYLNGGTCGTPAPGQARPSPSTSRWGVGTGLSMSATREAVSFSADLPSTSSPLRRTTSSPATAQTIPTTAGSSLWAQERCSLATGP